MCQEVKSKVGQLTSKVYQKCQGQGHANSLQYASTIAKLNHTKQSFFPKSVYSNNMFLLGNPLTLTKLALNLLD